MPVTQRSRTVGICLAAAAAVGVATAVAIAAGAAPACSGPVTASLAVTSDWGSGYQAEYTVSNGSERTLHGWTVSFDLPPGQTISSLWDGTMALSGDHVTVRNPAWEPDLATGHTASFGFVVDAADVSGAVDTAAAAATVGVAGAARSGSGAAPGAGPRNCLVDGAPCDGGTPAPSATGGPGTSAPAAGSGPSAGAGSEPPAAPSDAPMAGRADAPLSGPAGGGPYAFAPYVDTAQRQDLGAVAAAAGTKYLTAAFVLSSGGCSPAWNGAADPAFAPKLKAGLAALRAAGGDAIASFGGADGTELARACPDAAALAAAYRTVIDEYGFSHVDFDIEGPAADDAASIDRRSQALARLQAGYAAQGRKLTVSLTLPVLPTGLTAEGLAVVASAARNGLKVAVVNVMAMDYGDWAAPAPGGQMGAYADQSAQAVHDQLQTVYPAVAEGGLWSMIGITPMVGVNDTQDEVFTVADARTVAAFAARHRIGRLAMWSLTRDRPCPAGAPPGPGPACSSVVQAPYAFSNAFEAFTG